MTSRTEKTLSNLALMTEAELVEFYWATAESGAETESQEARRECELLLNVVDAIGELKFPYWRETKLAA